MPPQDLADGWLLKGKGGGVGEGISEEVQLRSGLELRREQIWKDQGRNLPGDGKNASAQVGDDAMTRKGWGGSVTSGRR